MEGAETTDKKMLEKCSGFNGIHTWASRIIFPDNCWAPFLTTLCKATCPWSLKSDVYIVNLIQNKDLTVCEHWWWDIEYHEVYLYTCTCLADIYNVHCDGYRESLTGICKYTDFSKKNFRPVRDLNPWPLRYRCSALPIELTSQLGAGQWIGSK